MRRVLTTPSSTLVAVAMAMLGGVTILPAADAAVAQSAGAATPAATADGRAAARGATTLAEPTPDIRTSASPSAGAAKSPSAGDRPVFRDAGRAAASWAARQLVDGDHVTGAYGDDPGLTADVVLALSLTGAHQARAQDASAWLRQNAEKYVTGGATGDVYAGSLAKLTLVAVATERPVKTFGPYNLPRALRQRMNADGRFVDRATFGDPTAEPSDFSNTFTQSLGILALRSAQVRVPPRAIRFLLRQQCKDGGYPVFYATKPGECVGDVDATGMVVQSLTAIDRTSDAKSAVQWLVEQQRSDGSFINGGPGGAPNTNSTAAASQALLVAGEDGAVQRARGWLLARQFGCTAPMVSRGAVGYTDTVIDDTALRATVQAAPALSGPTLVDLTRPTQPAAGAAPLPYACTPKKPAQPVKPAEPTVEPTRPVPPTGDTPSSDDGSRPAPDKPDSGSAGPATAAPNAGSATREGVVAGGSPSGASDEQQRRPARSSADPSAVATGEAQRPAGLPESAAEPTPSPTPSEEPASDIAVGANDGSPDWLSPALLTAAGGSVLLASAAWFVGYRRRTRGRHGADV